MHKTILLLFIIIATPHATYSFKEQHGTADDYERLMVGTANADATIEEAISTLDFCGNDLREQHLRSLVLPFIDPIDKKAMKNHVKENILRAYADWVLINQAKTRSKNLMRSGRSSTGAL